MDSTASDTVDGERRQCYLLSIGRIFHKISLCGSSITVTRYRPRHPYPPYNIQYRYRFQAPDHETYETSCVSFTTEKLENYSWNYLDHYICTRGDTDFPLVEVSFNSRTCIPEYIYFFCLLEFEILAGSDVSVAAVVERGCY